MELKSKQNCLLQRIFYFREFKQKRKTSFFILETLGKILFANNIYRSTGMTFGARDEYNSIFWWKTSLLRITAQLQRY